MDSSNGHSYNSLHPFQLPKLGKGAGKFRPVKETIQTISIHDLPSLILLFGTEPEKGKQTSQLLLSLGETLIHVLYIVNPFRIINQLDWSKSGGVYKGSKIVKMVATAMHSKTQSLLPAWRSVHKVVKKSQDGNHHAIKPTPLIVHCDACKKGGVLIA